MPKAWLVYAGLEPVRFTNLFPIWEVNEEAKASNLKVSVKVIGHYNQMKKMTQRPLQLKYFNYFYN